MNMPTTGIAALLVPGAAVRIRIRSGTAATDTAATLDHAPSLFTDTPVAGPRIGDHPGPQDHRSIQCDADARRRVREQYEKTRRC
ncbi:MAG: hypothetical protein Q4F49_09630 [Pseudoxanthomonas suwonensis]|nr:hypothetical protein [Pseudoxanthomonas suwonensis]